MAKVRLAHREAHRGGYNHPHERIAKIEIKRMPNWRAQREAFRACVTLGRRARGGPVCKTGSAPRRALAAAFRTLASNLVRRNSAFAGVR